LLLQFRFLPRLKKTWARLPLDKQLKRFGILALLDKLRDYALIALICLGIFTLFISVLSSHADSSADGIQHVVERVRSAKETRAHFKNLGRPGYNLVDTRPSDQINLTRTDGTSVLLGPFDTESLGIRCVASSRTAIICTRRMRPPTL
jgi:hypothetical protein